MLYRIIGSEVSTHRRVEIPNWDAPNIETAKRLAREIGVVISSIKPMNAPAEARQKKRSKAGRKVNTPIQAKQEEVAEVGKNEPTSNSSGSPFSRFLRDEGALPGARQEATATKSISLINCPACKKPVSEAANACPGCGFPLTPDIVAEQKVKKQKAEQGGALAVGVLFVVMMLFCSGAFTSSPSSPTSFSNLGDSSAQLRTQAHIPTVAETKLTLTNFEKIQTGMDRYDVGDILGRDYKTVAKSEFGQDTDYDLTTESLEWQDGFRVVTCMFQNGKLVSKAQAGLE